MNLDLLELMVWMWRRWAGVEVGVEVVEVGGGGG